MSGSTLIMAMLVAALLASAICLFLDSGSALGPVFYLVALALLAMAMLLDWLKQCQWSDDQADVLSRAITDATDPEFDP